MKSDSTTTIPRNLQLDFFRGLALMIIFINHMPFNPWFAYTPSRLGPSDAAETFVFLSGFAAAIAFGRSFRQAGLTLGSVRVLFRCGQIYLAHIILFLLMSTLLVIVTAWDADSAKWQLDNLSYFFDHTQDALLALVSLKYVPNFIDILPMYLVIMLWLPMVWALSRIHRGLAVLFSVSLYAGAHYFGWELTADPINNRVWYFNPFCWQLVFFTGFAFGSGWLPIPPFSRPLMWLCLAYAVFCYPLENAFGYDRLPWFAAFREQWEPLLDKSHLGIMRYLHFLAMTYLASNCLRKHPRWLQSAAAGQFIALGQQSLPIFMLGTCLSFLGGVLLDGENPGLIDSAWVNLAGLGLMLLAAQLLNWLDRKPWKNAGNATAFSLDTEWPKQAMLAFGLAFLTIAPLLFLHAQPADIGMAAAPIPEPDLAISGPEELSADAETLNTEEVAFQPQENPIELPDTL
ncbi:MAG: OpgC domain-containing protein [Methylomonas sp.]|nr:OpgC domain-containing protein [Methylomonas sp.]